MTIRSSLIRTSFNGTKGAFLRNNTLNQGKAFAFNVTRAMSDSNSTLPHRVDLETAKALPKNHDQMPNDILLTMAGK